LVNDQNNDVESQGEDEEAEQDNDHLDIPDTKECKPNTNDNDDDETLLTSCSSPPIVHPQGS